MLVPSKFPERHELLEPTVLFLAYELLTVEIPLVRRGRTVYIFDVGGNELRQVVNHAREHLK